MRRNLALATFLLAIAPCVAQSPASGDAGRADHATAEAGREPLDEPAGGSQPVPEPSTLLLVGTGLVGVALSTRWRRRKGGANVH